MKDKNGKETEKTFHLTGDVVMMDDTGKVVAIDFFRSGNDVLVLEEQGHLKELRKDKNAKHPDTTKPNDRTSTEKKPGK